MGRQTDAKVTSGGESPKYSNGVKYHLQTARSAAPRFPELPISPPTISDVVSKLIARGLVEEVGHALSSVGRRAIRCVVDTIRYRPTFRENFAALNNSRA
jgi:hypothetical protein